MTTFAQVRQAPDEYLGAGASPHSAELFIHAAEVLMAEDATLSEQDACEQVCNGDWYANALDIVARE